jgi:hypothetical protein
MKRSVSMLIAAVLSFLPSAPHAQTPPGERYLCYKAALAPKQPKFSAAQRLLEDQFWTFTADVKGYASLCNPVLSALHPAVHPVGYRTTIAKAKPAQKFVKSSHTAHDQFGSHPLTVLMPAELREPSAKVLGAGGTPTVSTAGVDRFECYRAAPQKGAPKFVATPVSISDQFGAHDLTLVKITRLCAPVSANGSDPTAPQHPGHLVCYQAKLPKGVKFAKTTVSVNNVGFGPAVLVAKAVAELCVPAFKDVLPTPSPLPTPTPGSTTTPTPGSTTTPTPSPRPTVTAVPTPRPTATCNIVNCPFPGSCQNGACVEPCGPTSCSPDALCCSSSPGDGICCDRASQRCSATQTSCETVVCPAGSTYVPSVNDCCPNASLCGTEPPSGIPGTDPDPNIPAFCCQALTQRCEPSTAQNPSPFGATCVSTLPTPTP